MTDHYAILGVKHGANKDEIRKAYRRLAIELHPDKHPGLGAEYEPKFKELCEAYEQLMKGSGEEKITESVSPGATFRSRINKLANLGAESKAKKAQRLREEMELEDLIISNRQTRRREEIRLHEIENGTPFMQTDFDKLTKFYLEHYRFHQRERAGFGSVLGQLCRRIGISGGPYLSELLANEAKTPDNAFTYAMCLMEYKTFSAHLDDRRNRNKTMKPDEYLHCFTKIYKSISYLEPQDFTALENIILNSDILGDKPARRAALLEKALECKDLEAAKSILLCRKIFRESYGRLEIASNSCRLEDEMYSTLSQMDIESQKKLYGLISKCSTNLYRFSNNTQIEAQKELCESVAQYLPEYIKDKIAFSESLACIGALTFKPDGCTYNLFIMKVPLKVGLHGALRLTNEFDAYKREKISKLLEGYKATKYYARLSSMTRDELSPLQIQVYEHMSAVRRIKQGLMNKEQMDQLLDMLKDY